MADTGSRWHDVVKALVALMRAVPGYRDPATLNGVGIPVFHSLEVALTEENPDVLLCIGYIGDPDTPQESGQAGQVVATLGTNHHRQEDGAVRCAVISQTGDLKAAGAVPALFDDAFAIVNDVDTMLRANGALGLATPSMVARIGGLPSIRSDPASGGDVIVEFEVIFSTRI